MTKCISGEAGRVLLTPNDLSFFRKLEDPNLVEALPFLTLTEGSILGRRAVLFSP